MSAEMLAILPRLAAAFNRSTLLIDASQPDGEDPADYYTDAITNHYARIVHATTTGGRARIPVRRCGPGRRGRSVRLGVRSSPFAAHRDAGPSALTQGTDSAH
jgi:hypothetical protein